MASKFSNSGPKKPDLNKKVDVEKMTDAEELAQARASQTPSEGVDDKGNPLNVITEDSFDAPAPKTKKELAAEVEAAREAQDPYPPVDAAPEAEAPRPAHPDQGVEVGVMPAATEPVMDKGGKKSTKEDMYPHRRFWVEISENPAAFLNFHPQFKLFSTKNAEQEAALTGLVFEITETEYMKRTNKDA